MGKANLLGWFHLFFNRALRSFSGVKTLQRILLWIVGGVVLVACVVLIGVNLYVQSQGMRHRIQQELSQRLGTPLSLRQISITPWSGLKLNGITIPQEPGKGSGYFLKARSFQLRVQFWSIFSDRLVIRQAYLIQPEVVWAQNSAGKWRLPTIPPEKREKIVDTTTAAGAPPPGNAIRTTPATTARTTPEVVSATNEPVYAPTPDSFTPEVQRVTLRDGSFTFLDSAGHVVAKFQELDFRSAFRTATEIKGNTSIGKISLRDRFFIQDLESPLRYDPAQLAFSNISARAAGGTISGRFEMQLQKEDSPFSATVKFRELQAEKLVANAGGPPGMIQGKLEGFLNATGKTADSNALSGEGEIILREGKLQQYSLLVALGQILQIDELMQLQLEQAEVKYHINPGIVTIDELLLRSPNIRLTATGTISFQGKLHLDSQLALNEKVRRQLFSPIRANFQPLKEPAGYAAVDFNVDGTVERPKTDLMDKLVGRDLRDLGGVISSLFGHAKKKKNKPQEKAAPSPTLAPSLTPAPTTPSPNDALISSSPAVPDEVTPAPQVIPESTATPSPSP
ncbi:MAG: AsmA-like C-terminal region-containing protein [Chthoniobacterales bacterium]